VSQVIGSMRGVFVADVGVTDLRNRDLRRRSRTECKPRGGEQNRKTN
jgi:hypothetical protein